MQNGKNRLHEFMKELGYFENCVKFHSLQPSPNSLFKIQASTYFADGRIVAGVGEGQKKVEAEIAACENVLSIIHEKQEDLLIDWGQVFVEAQAGDALIKLCAYLSDSFETIEQKSRWLQSLESDYHLARVFDALKQRNDPSVVIFGSNLGTKKKATWMEALIWKRFGKACLSAHARERLNELEVFLQN